MSFLKITDPLKRDFIVKQFLDSKNRIKQDSLSEKLGNISLQQELQKVYKPIIDSQAAISKEISSSTNVLRALPKAIQFPQYPSIEAYEPEDQVFLGELATKYLHKYASNKKLTDTTFGIKSKDGIFYIGDSEISIQGDNIKVGDKTYDGTPGLWELLTMTKPDKNIYDMYDRDNYEDILTATNAIRQPNNPNKPKSSRSEKYREIIKPIWDKKFGKGLVVIPQDPNALAEMLDLRMASYNAGNTGVRNEIVSICDELLRQSVIDKNDYKKLILRI